MCSTLTLHLIYIVPNLILKRPFCCPILCGLEGTLIPPSFPMWKPKPRAQLTISSIRGTLGNSLPVIPSRLAGAGPQFPAPFRHFKKHYCFKGFLPCRSPKRDGMSRHSQWPLIPSPHSPHPIPSPGLSSKVLRKESFFPLSLCPWPV